MREVRRPVGQADFRAGHPVQRVGLVRDGLRRKGEKSESDAKTEKSEKTDTKAKTESSPATKPEKSSAPKTSGGD
jgi:hypothetical protein